MPFEITLIGRGAIGQAVAAGIARMPGLALAAIHGRAAAPRFATPLTIDAAGPAALRAHGAAALRVGDLWSVGAAALLDDNLREALLDTARAHGTRLRLFTGWIAGPNLCPPDLPARLDVIQEAPLLSGHTPGLIFRGPLAEAGRRFPDHLNSATAAALAGPGIAATRITLRATPADGAHRIAARFTMPGQTLRSEVRFDRPGPHPVAAALLAALAARASPLAYG